MKLTISLALAVAAIALCADRLLAAPTYYNVDNQTLPNGPITLANPVVTPVTGGFTFSGDATDTGGQTYSNVRYLNEWMFDAFPTAYSYGGSNTWTSTDGGNWSVPSPSGTMQASQVVTGPTSWTSGSFPSAGPASVAGTDLLPYINIGTVAPGFPVHFSETVLTNLPSNAHFDFVSSFVSTTPVPEPSTLALSAMAVVGAAIATRRRLVCMRK